MPASLNSSVAHLEWTADAGRNFDWLARWRRRYAKALGITAISRDAQPHDVIAVNALPHAGPTIALRRVRYLRHSDCDFAHASLSE